jgi:hypothetical protein
MRNVIIGKRLNPTTKYNLFSENVRFLNSSAPASTVTASISNKGHLKSETLSKKHSNVPPSSGPGRKDELDVSFNDPLAAFKSKTTSELIRAYFVYVLCSSEKLVEHNMKVNSYFFQRPPSHIEKMEKSIIFDTLGFRLFLSGNAFGRYWILSVKNLFWRTEYFEPN